MFYYLLISLLFFLIFFLSNGSKSSYTQSFLVMLRSSTFFLYSWALSTLFVGLDDIFPANITAATEEIQHVNLLPVYGLNVHSMLKHKTLVLTEKALDRIEDRLLLALNRADDAKMNKRLRNPSLIHRPQV